MVTFQFFLKGNYKIPLDLRVGFLVICPSAVVKLYINIAKKIYFPRGPSSALEF